MYQLKQYQNLQLKKQAKIILNKINLKNYYENCRQRSEGFQIADDYGLLLKQTVKRSRTQKLTIKKIRNNEKRQMTIPYTEKQKQIIIQFQEKVAEKRRAATYKPISVDQLKIQYEQFLENQLSQRKPYGESQKEIEKINDQNYNCRESKQNNFYLSKQKCNSQKQKSDVCIEKFSQSMEQDKNITQSNLNSSSQMDNYNFFNFLEEKKQYNAKKAIFLPQLQLYIEEQQSLKKMTYCQQRIRNLIIQMMILALNRKHNGKPYDALDILLQTEVYFPKNQEMKRLKSTWLSLIQKVYFQIKKQIRTKKGKGRSRKSTVKNSSSEISVIKRKKTFVIRTLVSRRAFINRFSNNLRKMHLIYESSFNKQLKNPMNIFNPGQKHNRIVSKLNNTCFISYPSPKTLYPEMENITNYSIILVNKDSETNLFPNVYPQNLENYICKEQYIEQISKINSFLIPSTKCMSFQVSLYQKFELIFSIFAITIIAIILIMITEQFQMNNPYFILMCFAIISITYLSLRIFQKNCGSNHAIFTNQIYDPLQRLFIGWEEKHERKNMKFIINENIDLIIISFPILKQNQDLSSTSSHSFSQTDNLHSNKTMSKKRNSTRNCSLKVPERQMFANPMDQIDQKSESSSESQQMSFDQYVDKKESSCKSNATKQRIKMLQSFQDESYSDESQDEVLDPQQQPEYHINVNFVEREQFETQGHQKSFEMLN